LQLANPDIFAVGTDPEFSEIDLGLRKGTRPACPLIDQGAGCWQGRVWDGHAASADERGEGSSIAQRAQQSAMKGAGARPRRHPRGRASAVAGRWERLQVDSLSRRALGVWFPQSQPWRVSPSTDASMSGHSVVGYGARPRRGAAGKCPRCSLFGNSPRLRAPLRAILRVCASWIGVAGSAGPLASSFCMG
jgi:hypothetical protein